MQEVTGQEWVVCFFREISCVGVVDRMMMLIYWSEFAFSFYYVIRKERREV